MACMSAKTLGTRWTLGDTRAHPHIDNPTETQLRQVIEEKPPTLQGLYLDIHRLVLEAIPDLAYSVDCHDGEIGYGAHQYGYNGWGMAALTPYAKWVSLAFLRGTALADPDGLLEGTGATVRHIKFRSTEQLKERRDAIKRFLGAAARVNQREHGA